MPLICACSFHRLVADIDNGNISLDNKERAQNSCRVLQESKI